jgi:hypothetical protein
MKRTVIAGTLSVLATAALAQHMAGTEEGQDYAAQL